MRGDPDTPAPVPAELLSRAARRTAAAGLALLILAAVTGGAASPAVALVAASLVVLLRYANTAAVLLAPPGCALALLGASAVGDGIGLIDVLGAAALTLGAYPGLLWRRESKRAAQSLAQLEEILAAADRGGTAPAPTAAEELADLELVLRGLAERLGAALITLWDVDGLQGRARPRVVSGGRRMGHVRLSGDPLGWAWEQGMRLRLDPPPRWAPQGAAVIAERLRRSGDYGELVSYAFPPGGEAPDEAALDQAAVYLRGIVALQDARSVAAAGKRRLDALLNGLREIPRELDLETLARELCTIAMNVTDATGATVGVWEGDRGHLLAVTGDDGGPGPGDTFELPASELAIAILAETMVPRDAATWSLGRTAIAHTGERWTHRPRTMAALPLRGAAGTVGVLAVWSSRSPALDPYSLELLGLVAPYAALHLEHARAYGRLRETADRDPLTQLRNRRSFEEAFAAETTRFERYGRPLALLMLDIDHFKSINDTYGHEAGDEVLRRVARVVAAGVRDSDYAARYGGEEFVVLLPEATLAAASEVAERVRLAVSALVIDWRGSAIPVHVSAGVSATPERVTHPRDLIASADTALYSAKATGRDRVVTA